MCEYPKIDEKFHRHFIRGYFDGDGCLSIYNIRNRVCYSFSIVGGEKMLKAIQEKIPYKITFYKSTRHNVATIYLDRKYSKYKELKAID